MTGHIVYIHGLGPKPAPSVLEQRELRYLSEGAGFAIPAENFHLAYWVDLMGYLPETPEKDEYKEGGNNFRTYSLLEKIQFAIREKARTSINNSIEDLLRGYLQGSALEQPGTEQKIVDALLSFLSNKPAELVYRRFLKDLHRYFFDGKREDVLNRLHERIASIPSTEPVCLIAHSMGSIIALDLLLPGTRNIEQVITIGSPLGIPVVQHQLGAIGSPEADQRRKALRDRIGIWRNFYDTLDLVALDNDLKDDFPEQAILDIKVRNEFVTKNGERNHHKSYGYLRTPEVGRAIETFFQKT